MIKKISPSVQIFKSNNFSNYNSVRTKSTFDNFIKEPQVHTSAKNKNTTKLLISGAILAGGTALIAFGIYRNRHKIKELLELQKLKKFSKDLAKKYPQDDQYRKRIAQNIGLSEKESYKLSSIMGSEELYNTMVNNAYKPEIFSPGSAIFDKRGKITGFRNENISTQLFGINLHTHTVHSDGDITVKQLLKDARIYANQRIASRNEPFYIGITDHDSIEGCKEAVEIIKKNPLKYKNLRVLLGLETTTTYKNPSYLNNEGQFHLLSYGINPFSPEINGFLAPRIEKNQRNIRNALSEANELYGNQNGLNFNIDDFALIRKSLKTGLRNAEYYIKDYLQFKLIFNETVSKNRNLLNFLKKEGVKVTNRDYAKPIKFIGENLDYSNGQKYYDYYYKALQQHILSQIRKSNPTIPESKIKQLFPQISKETKITLDAIEKAIENKTSKLHVPSIELIDFEKSIEALSKAEDGVFSFAHPGIIFPANSVKDTKKLPELYKKLYSLFREKGKEKAQYVEGFYQSYFNSPELPIYRKLIEIGKEFGFKFTGGLDTHSTNILSK